MSLMCPFNYVAVGIVTVIGFSGVRCAQYNGDGHRFGSVLTQTIPPTLEEDPRIFVIATVGTERAPTPKTTDCGGERAISSFRVRTDPNLDSRIRLLRAVLRRDQTRWCTDRINEGWRVLQPIEPEHCGELSRPDVRSRICRSEWGARARLRRPAFLRDRRRIRHAPNPTCREWNITHSDRRPQRLRRGTTAGFDHRDRRARSRRAHLSHRPERSALCDLSSAVRLEHGRMRKRTSVAGGDHRQHAARIHAHAAERGGILVPVAT